MPQKTFFEQYLQSTANAMRDRVSDNPPLETVEEKTVTEESPGRIQEFKKTVYRKTRGLADLVMMDNTVGKAFPGALLWAAAVRDGQLHELEQIPNRPRVTVTFSGFLPTDLPAEMRATPIGNGAENIRRVSFEHNGTYADFEERARPILAGNKPGGPRVISEYQVSTSLKDALLSIGMSAKYWENRMSANLVQLRDERRCVALLTLDQVFYSASTDAPPLGGYLPNQIIESSPVVAERLARGAATGGEVAYVRKVDYGRRILVALSAESSVESLKRAISASVKAFGSEVDGSVTDEVKNVWNSVEGKLVVIGGAFPEGVSSLFGGSIEGFVTAVKSIMSKEHVVYDPKSGAAPISFELGYVADNAPMQVFETVEFAGKIPTRSFGKVTRSETITTAGADAAVLRDDSEIDSDDWTMVQLTSQNLRLSADRRTLHFDLVWHAFEAESNKTIRNDRTMIRSSKTFSYSFPKAIRSIESPQSIGSRDEWYAGELHTHQRFPNHGLLSNIQVKFDAKGDHDDQKQSLIATLEFTVWLEE